MRISRKAMLAAATAFAVAATGCGSGDEGGSASGATNAGSDDGVNVAFLAPLSNEPVIRLLEGARRYAAAHDAEVTGIDVGFDPQRQLRAVQDAVTSRRYDAILVTPFDQTGGNLRAAADAGLPIVTAFTTVGPDINAAEPQLDWVTAQIYDRWDRAGTAYGESVVEACEGVDPCKVAIMPGQGIGAEVSAVDAMKAVLDEQPNIETITTKPGAYDPAVARGIIADTLQANDDLAVIAAIGDQMALGAIPAVAAAGKSDQVRIYGMTASARAVDAVRDGRMYGTVLLNSLPIAQGEIAAEMAIDAARGRAPRQRGVEPDYGAFPRVMTEANEAEWADFRPQLQG